MTTWLVTGGAGYIGSHVVRAFLDRGITPVVLDNLSTGKAAFVPEGVAFVEGDILDTDLVANTLSEHGCVGVIHLAAYKFAGLSVQRPLHTYTQNVTGTVSVLEAMERSGVSNIVFSSSAAVFGTPTGELVTEEAPTEPESPYGESKLIGEWLIRDQVTAHPGFRGVSLRYFNVVGVDDPSLFDSSAHNLFPIVVRALRDGRTPVVHGDDYPTRDGSCIRDYVHVGDLAISHVAAAEALAHGSELAPVYNLGSGVGLSVKEIMDAFARVTGVDFQPQIGPRRPGDPALIVADGQLAARDLDWKMRHTVDDMVAGAWAAGAGQG